MMGLKTFGDAIKIVKEVDLTDKVPPLPFEKAKKAAEEYINEIKNIPKFINVDIFDFTEFNIKLDMPDFGEYIFKVEHKFLKEAIRIIGLCSQTGVGLVGITLFEDKMKLSLFNQVIFSEIFIPLSEKFDTTSFNKKKNLGISFTFEYELLNKVASRFVDSCIVFKLDIEKNILMVHSGNTKLELAVPLEYRIVDYHLKLNDPKHLCKIDFDVFRDAIKYISYFVQKNDVKKNLSQADWYNQMLCGGSFSSVGIYKSYVSKDFKINIKYECLNYLYRILPYFNKDNTHIFETKNYYIIRENNLYFGFEKSNYSFPPVDKFLKADVSEDKIVVLRKDLLESLNKLSIVLSGVKPLIKLSICEGDKLKLFVKDASGKISMDILNILLEEKLPDLNFIIEFETFRKIVSHFNSEKFYIRYILNKALVIKDEDKNFVAMSNFSLFLEDDMNQI